MRPRISVVTIAVASLARSREFYVAGLGFPEHPDSGMHAVFLDLEGTWLTLAECTTLLQWAGLTKVVPGASAVILSHNVREAEEVDRVLERAVRAGGRLHTPAADRPVGRIGYFADPDGYLWEVACTPKWSELLA